MLPDRRKQNLANCFVQVLLLWFFKNKNSKGHKNRRLAHLLHIVNKLVIFRTNY